MRGINTVFILGCLGKEVQITITQSGRSFVDISIATNRTIQKDKGLGEKTDWHQVRFWGKQAEICQQYLSKGSLVAIDGSLRTDQWTDDNGKKQYRSYIYGEDIHLLPSVSRETSLR